MGSSKQFFDLVEADLCHGRNSIILDPVGPSLYCTTCHEKPIPDLYQYIREAGKEADESCRLAQAYYEWTQDEDTPVSFNLVHGRGVLNKRVEGQLLSRLRETVQLLKAINAPFIKDGPPWKMTDDMKGFLTKFANAIVLRKPAFVMTREEQLLSYIFLPNLIRFLRQRPNLFECYFEETVPYLKTCEKDGFMLKADIEEPILARDLTIQLDRSLQLRMYYSKYSPPFDVIHVMLGCYVCSVDFDMVANWVLDLMVRAGRGGFFWDNFPNCWLVRHLQEFLKDCKEPQLYNVIQEIQRGNAIKTLDEFARLDKWVRDTLVVPDTDKRVVKTAIVKLFPKVLFKDNAEYVGFLIASGYVRNYLDPDDTDETYQNAREIDSILQKYIRSMCKFDSDQRLWTLDTLHEFVLSEQSFVEDIVKIGRLIRGW